MIRVQEIILFFESGVEPGTRSVHIIAESALILLSLRRKIQRPSAEQPSSCFSWGFPIRRKNSEKKKKKLSRKKLQSWSGEKKGRQGRKKK